MIPKHSRFTNLSHSLLLTSLPGEVFMLSNLKIRWKFLLSSFLVLAVVGSLTTAFVIHSIQEDARKEIVSFKTQELEKKKQNLKNYVDIAYATIDSNYKNARDTQYLTKVYGNRLRFIVDAAQAIIKDLQAEVKQGKLSMAAAQQQAIKEIGKIRYDNGKGYIWINDTGSPYPKMIMHPTVPALDGKVMDNPKFNCALGKKENLFKAFVDVCAKKGEGFVDYLWPKPTANGLSQEQPKLSYVREIADWDWIIGTGIYVDDALADAIEKSRQDIKKMRYDGGKGYFWINDTGNPYPKMIMHPTVPALDGKVMDAPKFNCALGKKENLFKAFVDVCKEKGEGFVDYLWPKPSKEGLTEEQPKLSYVKLYEPLNWIIGTGVYIDDIDKVVQAKKVAMNRQVKTLLLKVGAIALVVSIGGLFCLLLVAGRISKPIIDCAVSAQKMGEGDLNAALDISSGDEVGQLASSLMNMQNNLKGVLGNITSTSQNLADGASSQAAAVEEASASLGQMAAMTRQNAENANQGQRLTDGTKITVEEANTAMQELATSMKEISEASRETQKIVKTIDEIAFQTNLLALNAAVEAARAGEAGAGFAVVADEVRSLAMRAAEAARNTANLIEGTVAKVEHGDHLAMSTSDKFSRLTETINKVSVLVSEITQASNEQASGIDQLNSAMADINVVTQTNASTAQNLVDMVGRFGIDEEQHEQRMLPEV